MRQQGQYAHSGVNTYVGSQMHNVSGQRMEHKPGHFQGRLEAFTPEREHPYGTSNEEGQWRWERDGSKVSNSMASYMSNEGKCYLLFVYVYVCVCVGVVCMCTRGPSHDRGKLFLFLCFQEEERG
jgi:hypothetical protein